MTARIGYLVADPGVVPGSSKGAAVHVESLVRAWCSQGHRVTLITTRAAPGFVVPDRCEVIELGAPPFRSSSAVLREAGRCAAESTRVRMLTRLLKARAVDVIVERSSLFAFAGRVAARRAGLPYVLEVNAPLALEQRAHRVLRLRPLAEALERRAWRNAGHVVAVSDGIASLVAQAGGVASVIPNAVDTDVFVSPAIANSRPAGLAGSFVVAFSGRPRPWHDLDTVIRAIESLGGRARLLLIGDAGPLASHPLVHATGWVAHEDVPAHLALADAAVCPLAGDDSYFSPLKLMEYLAMSLPVAGAGVGRIRDVLTAAGGILYAPGDVESLATALRRLAGDPALRARLGSSGRAIALHHTWTAAARRMIEPYAFDKEQRIA